MPRYNSSPNQGAYNNMSVSGPAASDDSITETISTPAQSIGAFGSDSVIDFRNMNLGIHSCVLAVGVSAISGLTGSVAGYPYFNPAWNWIDKLDILVNNEEIQTMSGDNQFHLHQLFYRNEDRDMINLAVGNYKSTSQRNTLSITPSVWYIPIHCVFNQVKWPLLNTNHQITIRIRWLPVTSLVSQSTLTGTPVATITSLNLLTKVSRFSEPLTRQMSSILSAGKQYKYHEFRKFQYSLASGLPSAEIPLTGVTGKVAFVFFRIRITSEIIGDTVYTNKPITDFVFRSSSGSNIVGGTPILSKHNLLIQGADWSPSSYLSEAFLGTNNSYVYLYSWSKFPEQAIKYGSSSGAYQFQGSESLLLTFPSALSAPHTFDLLAVTEASLTQSLGKTIKSSKVM